MLEDEARGGTGGIGRAFTATPREVSVLLNRSVTIARAARKHNPTSPTSPAAFGGRDMTKRMPSRTTRHADPSEPSPGGGSTATSSRRGARSVPRGAGRAPAHGGSARPAGGTRHRDTRHARRRPALPRPLPRRRLGPAARGAAGLAAGACRARRRRIAWWMPSGRSWRHSKRSEGARQRGGLCVWHVVGCRRVDPRVAARRGWNGRPVGHAQAQASSSRRWTCSSRTSHSHGAPGPARSRPMAWDRQLRPPVHRDRCTQRRAARRRDERR